MKITNTIWAIRQLSVAIRREATYIHNLPEMKRRTSPTFSKILHTHSEIWYITGQILQERKKKSNDTIVIVPGKGIHTHDTIFDAMQDWTEVLTTKGPVKHSPRNSSKKPKEEKFGSAKLREMLKFDSSGRCINAFQILSDKEFLKIAYDIIKSNPGNMVQGSDKITLDGLPLTWFEKTSKSLVNESYKFKPARRVLIPKPNGKKRPLGISSPRDKIIQQATKLVMEEVLEPKFSDLSHGFRPSRGCHSALAAIRKWNGVPWLLEGDIKGFFDNIDHNLLAKLIMKHFKEKRLLNLYWKLVKAGYIEWDNNKRKFINPEKGVPQGGIVSPLLSNLILHELDVYIEKLIEQRAQLNKGEKKTNPNPLYDKLSRRISLLRKKLRSSDPQSYKEYRKELRMKLKERRKFRSTLPNPRYIKIEYVRYADDWVVGVWGPKTYLVDLKQKVLNFLGELKLELSLEKTLITNTITDRAKFLGTMINRKASTLWKRTYNDGRGRRICNTNTQVVMDAPIQKLIDKLEAKAFIKVKEKKLIPQVILELTPLPTKELILRFRSILLGILNYYSFADNRPHLRQIYYLLKECLIRTIQHKERCNRKTLLKQYGNDIVLNIKTKDGKNKSLSFACPPLHKQTMNFSNKLTTDPLLTKVWKISTISPLGQPCANCGSEERVEMHHIKHIRTINPNLSSFDKMVARINRKQVPLCRLCHRHVHNGTYFGFTLKHFKFQKWTGKAKWA